MIMDYAYMRHDNTVLLPLDLKFMCCTSIILRSSI